MWKIREDMLNHYINGLSSKTFRDMQDRINYLEEELAKVEESKKQEEGLVLKLNAPLDIILRCTICTNHMRSDTGCDGNCRVDENLLKKIVVALTDNKCDGGINE